MSGDGRPVSVLWITSGLGCDGDSIAMTAATNPSLEDLPARLPAGDAAGGALQRGVRVRDGRRLPAGLRRRRPAARSTRSSSCSKARSQTRRSTATATGRRWESIGSTGQPILTCDWLDRLTPRAAAVLALGTCAAYGGVPAMRNNPTGHGPARLPGGQQPPGSGTRLSTCPAASCSLTTSRRRSCAWCSSWPASARGSISTSRAGRGEIFGRTVPEGCDRARFTEQGGSRREPAAKGAVGEAGAGPGRHAATSRCGDG